MVLDVVAMVNMLEVRTYCVVDLISAEGRYATRRSSYGTKKRETLFDNPLRPHGDEVRLFQSSLALGKASSSSF